MAHVKNTGDGKTEISEGDLLTLFARNQMRVSVAMPLLAAICAAVSLLWAPWFHSLTWVIAAAGSQAMQLYLCKRYLDGDRSTGGIGEWIGMLAASELMLSACWSSALFVFWNGASDLQHLFLVAVVMAAAPVRIVISANFMPVVLAGTGFVTIAVAVRCLLQMDFVYAAMGGMAIALEVIFLQIARRLQETARDMLFFKAEKERLFEALRGEKEQAESERRKAVEANAAKSRFLATMSHELRTPLNAILGFSEIMSRETFGKHHVEAYKSYASDINQSGSYLLALINDILDLSRIEAGRRDLQETPVEVAGIAEDAYHLVAPRARAKRQRVDLDMEAALPKLLADERAARQIVINLLTNAVKFAPEGGRIVVQARRGENGTLVLSVIDNGPGIPKHELDQALGAFSRGSYATKKAIEGAGLGLPIVRGLAELHGATLAIDSEPGKGTVATVTFPQSRVLGGPRGEILSSERMTQGQRRLIGLAS